jgi:hypothetical protein
MWRVAALALLFLGVGCATHRPKIPSPAFELETSQQFFAKPGTPGASDTLSLPGR